MIDTHAYISSGIFLTGKTVILHRNMSCYYRNLIMIVKSENKKLSKLVHVQCALNIFMPLLFFFDSDAVTTSEFPLCSLMSCS